MRQKERTASADVPAASDSVASSRNAASFIIASRLVSGQGGEVSVDGGGLTVRIGG